MEQHLDLKKAHHLYDLHFQIHFALIRFIEIRLGKEDREASTFMRFADEMFTAAQEILDATSYDEIEELWLAVEDVTY